MKTIAWNVDTQYDFMRADGKLAVKDAHAIEPKLETLTRLWHDRGIVVVNTADWHTKDSAEISDTPDFKSTYPPHCMSDTAGAAYVPATEPEAPYVVDWRDVSVDVGRVRNTRNIVLYKDAFDVFAGNPHTDAALDALAPDRVFVYGVATNVCVDFAVRGLLERGKEVFVIRDAIKALPPEHAQVPLEQTLRSWEHKGVKYTTVGEVERYL